MAAGRDVKDAIVKEISTAKVDPMELDLSSLASVRKFASDFSSSGRPLNLLIHSQVPRRACAKKCPAVQQRAMWH
ncbi:hypothetical protein BDE02_12G118600 [Populus trichocarpa]|nr:hypothetical protein BDE02_12G118600 [Populus trichocarpa]